MPEERDPEESSFIPSLATRISLTSPRQFGHHGCIVVSADADLWIDAGPADYIFIQATAVYSRPLVTEQQQAGRQATATGGSAP
jgi:hypothetical protein